MDIFNRPPSIAEDTVQYSVHLPPNSSDRASATAFATCILNFVESLLSGFIWHRDEFEVKVVQGPGKSGSWLLEGRMRVGDSIDDEWCTVWLLKEISLKWDVTISVYDSDGEFLLIEAAEVLPSWVKPTNSENRVWIRNSRLHLIPRTHVSPNSQEPRRRNLDADSDDEISGAPEDDEFISVSDALKVMKDPLSNTLAPLPVEDIVWKRIQGYPSALTGHVHMTKAYIPEDIVKALSVNAALIQRAVETFYTRDAVQLRVAHRMSRFPPHTSVLASVRMTRTAYAQLSGQKFFPPKIFGQWKEPEGSSAWRWKDIGMKIAVGFEMLYQESKPRQIPKTRVSGGVFASPETLKETLQRDPEYQKYIESLVSANYFKGELRDSELWKTLENKAATTFVDARRNDDVSRLSFAARVDSAVSSANPLPGSLDFGEDSENWLIVDADGFDHMLENTLGRGQPPSKRDPNAMDVDVAEAGQSIEDRLASQQTKQLKDLANKVETFIEGQGDLEGALFEDEEFSDEPFSDDGASSDSESEQESPVDNEKRNAERQAAMDKLVPALRPSEYGVMPPSYHENSQRVASATITSDIVEEGPITEPKTAEPKTTKSKPLRPPIITRDRYDGVDSDDEYDIELDSEEEERPQVVGEVEIDMEAEEEEFLEFSRQALGISDDHWAEIIEDRRKRGAFLPPSTMKSPTSSKKPDASQSGTQSESHVSDRSSQPEIKPKLESFEAVMKALDEVLAQSQSHKRSKENDVEKPNDTKGKKKVTIEDEMEMADDPNFNIDAAMEAELKQALEIEDGELDDPVDYNLIKNFLESFKSQEGLSGPVSNLVGRLVPDFKLPRDTS